MSSEQIEQLKKDIQKRINEEEKGVSTYLNTILTQVNVTLQKNASPNLNSLDFAVLRLMMIEYLNNIFNK
jgi:hypothetical protein